jgi:hypothetical protein
MLIAADSVTGFAFKHGPAQVTPCFVAPEKFGTAGQIAMAAQGIRALVMHTAPATAHTGQIRHAILRVLRGAVPERKAYEPFVEASSRACDGKVNSGIKE